MKEIQTKKEFCVRIYEGNKSRGWYDSAPSSEAPREDIITYVNMKKALIVTELAEAMEGTRKNLMDDHLTLYPMAPVELADAIIRCCDLIGYLLDLDDDKASELYLPYTTIVGIERIRTKLNKSASPLIKYRLCNLLTICIEVNPLITTTNYNILTLLHVTNMCLFLGQQWGANMPEIIEAKLIYNSKRADHKRENRAKEGGKKE